MQHFRYDLRSKIRKEFLYIFCDFETTGDREHRITDIGAVSVLEKKFSLRNIKTLSPIDLNELIGFVKGEVEILSRAMSPGNPVDYTPVLIAHNGFVFDFQVLLNDISRNKLDFMLRDFETILFADTLEHLQEMKEKGSPLLGDSKLGLEDLFKKFFPKEQYKGHKNGLLDAENLKRLFTETELKKELSSLKKQTFDELYARNREGIAQLLAVPWPPLAIATRNSMFGDDLSYVPWGDENYPETFS